PDNFQEEPYIGSIGRTSPTNIGLGLASAYAAYEFGYLSTGHLLDQIGNTLGSMKMLDRYSGHFFNWYSTQRGEVIGPRYISTVDSGNLAACLLLVKQGLNRLSDSPWPHPAFWEGLQDTLKVLGEINGETRNRLESFERTADEIDGLLAQIEGLIDNPPPVDPAEWEERLAQLLPETDRLGTIDFGAFAPQLSGVELKELSDWFKRPFLQVDRQLQEVRRYIKSGGRQTGESRLRLRDLYALEPFSRWESRIGEMVSVCDQMVLEMDFNILYYKKKGLFSIGYNIDRAALDKSTYDLLASEARLASFIAIAKGDVPPDHWFKLSRRLTSIRRNEILLSWGGTMFEYLMPLLFLSRFEGTLLSNTYENAVRWQKQYGESRNQPWGFSESGYAVLNMELQYQYRAFGAPGLGLRRGLAEDYVVAPYSSLLALMVRPAAALDNLDKLRGEGVYGLNGFYEAIDYTPDRGNTNGEKTIVKMYMAHHQGMGLLALSNVLMDNKIQRLFHSDPLVKACELLLQERIPRGIPIKEPRPIDVELEPGEEQKGVQAVDHSGQDALAASPPRTHLLSNGRYTTVITHAGTGYAACNGRALTRWRAERVKDALGFFIYVKDLESNRYWSAGHRPVNRTADRYDTWFHAGKVQIARVDDWIETFMEVCVSPEDDIELRKLTLTNYSDRVRRLELTSYAEVVLNKQQADEAHPAFSNLFIQTEHIPEHHALLARRRPRSADEEQVWLVHTLASEDLQSLPGSLQFETNREKFIGRGRSLDAPAAMDPGNRLSGSKGNVPDPVVSLRRVIELKPGEKKSVTFGLGTVDSRNRAVAMADHYDNPYATDRIFELASIYGKVELDHIGITGERAHYFQKLAGAMIYGNEQLRADEETLVRNYRTQSGLWAYGISGDLPILVYRIREVNHLRYVERLLKAHTFWRLKGVEIDLVIINDHPPSYIDELHEAIQRQIQASPERHLMNKKGGIFLLRGEEMSVEDGILLDTVAAVSMQGKLPKLDFSNGVLPSGDKPESGSESESESEAASEPDRVKKDKYRLLRISDLNHEGISRKQDLLFYNGYGGFNHTGTEYVVRLAADDQGKSLVFPPAPWINVIANPGFGFITSERGSDYTWSINSRENRLTPWSNDAVIDPAGEAIYIRDEDHRLFWSPTPGPSPGSSQYEIRYGFGYVRHVSRTLNIDQEVTKWVPVDDPVKLIRVRLTNSDLMARTFSVYHYLEWVLGAFREQSSRYVVTERDRTLSAILARNSYNNEFTNRIAFFAAHTEAEILSESYTCDRTWFIGKNRGGTNPRALTDEENLSGRIGAGFDPCTAAQLRFRLESGESAEIHFILGEAESRESANAYVRKYRDSSVIEASLEEAISFWKRKLERIQISTPAHELDILFNGWLQYQNIACRMWARSGFYQSGGAFGFRDQLQDAAAALYLDPGLARTQILRHAAHQFTEGDVLHWWHPPTGRGIRSRITDDLLWLPYVTSFYVVSTGDTSILDETVPFISARPLEEGEHEAYLTPVRSGEEATLYEHGCRAIDRSLTRGPHGLPLIGTGDWNDGMDRVGEQGNGESVWLGFFLSAVLSDFIGFCRQRDDRERVDRYESYRSKLAEHLNTEGWDGEWYRRAFYDDGTPLGSSQNDECKIDAIAQAWAVISGVAPEDKARRALESAGHHLVSEKEGIIRLLTPPFDRTEKNPGYIKGYIPGVRENGGQYTHGALWLIKAYAEMDYGNWATYLMRMVSPIIHSLSKERADRYRVEPYAVAADIYGEPPLVGRGGWTWYTGSAGWMYRVIAESILGLTLSGGDTVTIDPAFSADWNSFKISLRELDGQTLYEITVSNPYGLEKGKVVGRIDGEPLEEIESGVSFRFRSDGNKHNVELEIVEKNEVKRGK
ncbi:MAG: glucoamylase family protein, partial [Balneolaceae bacterium]|nr:glucoamylase family protein [Balneolaceae bacterium]